MTEQLSHGSSPHDILYVTGNLLLGGLARQLEAREGKDFASITFGTACDAGDFFDTAVPTGRCTAPDNHVFEMYMNNPDVLRQSTGGPQERVYTASETFSSHRRVLWLPPHYREEAKGLDDNTLVTVAHTTSYSILPDERTAIVNRRYRIVDEGGKEVVYQGQNDPVNPNGNDVPHLKMIVSVVQRALTRSDTIS